MQQPPVSSNFYKEMDEIYREAKSSMGPADLKHLNKMVLWGRLCTIVGYALAPFAINPISIILISLGKFSRWTMIGHHVSHRGYDRVPNVPKQYHSKTFAMGFRRYIDWFDWIAPVAWNEEHNRLHHYNLGEEADPDCVEKNLEWLRESPLPRWSRYLIVGLVSTCWKMIYYAPNTLLAMKIQKNKDSIQKKRLNQGPPWAKFMNVFWPTMFQCWLPYITWNFIVIPGVFYLINPAFGLAVLINVLFAEALTNIHSFFVITPNHAGEDLYQFDSPGANKYEFYFRQIVGSVNYRCGGDLNDFLHGWLNYQIEHHVMPDLSMLQYQKIQPKVQALCEKYSVPYKQESIFIRIVKTVNIMVGPGNNKIWSSPTIQPVHQPVTVES